MRKLILLVIFSLVITGCTKNENKPIEMSNKSIESDTEISSSSDYNVEESVKKQINVEVASKNLQTSGPINMDEYVGIYRYNYEHNSESLVEDHYIVVENINDQLTGRYYGTSDEFDESREGYPPGFFVLEMINFEIASGEISFKLELNSNETFTYPLKLHIRNSNEVKEEINPLWLNSHITGEKSYNGVAKDKTILLSMGNSTREFMYLGTSTEDDYVDQTVIKQSPIDYQVESLYETDFYIGEFLLGMKKRHVKDILDEQELEYISEVHENPAFKTESIKTSSMELTLVDDTLYSIRLFSDSQATMRGLSIGDDIEKIILLYGKPIRITEEIWEYFYKEETYTLMFIEIENELVNEITISLTM